MENDDGLLKSEGNNIPFGDLVFGDKIGAGNFGKVKLTPPLRILISAEDRYAYPNPTPSSTTTHSTTHNRLHRNQLYSPYPLTTQVDKGEYFGNEVGE